jgi:hypothetical protein
MADQTSNTSTMKDPEAQDIDDVDMLEPLDVDNPPDTSEADGWELPMPVAPDPTDSPTQ